MSSNRILTLNVGASKVVLAEYLITGRQSLQLLNYDSADMDIVGEDTGAALTAAIREILKKTGIRPAPVCLSLSGQMVFPRFVCLEASSPAMLSKLVQGEVEQNVPFPMDEIVWDRQFIGDGSSGSQPTMIVAAKLEHVRMITDAVDAAGLKPDIVDVAPMAIYNCLRYNYPTLTGCSIILDIGSRSTNLIFVEDDKIYNRCIPVAGNAITHELAKSFDVSPEEAEKIKKERGYVSMGGAYVDADEITERVSKIVRNVMTRLHAEISRSINFYRSQQGGTAPVRLFLTGGTSVLPQIDTFFRDKLQIEVDYLNPFNGLAFGPKIDAEKARDDAFVLAESAGLALRGTDDCAVCINLLPPEIVKSKQLRKRLPFLAAAGAMLVASMCVWIVIENGARDVICDQAQQVEARSNSLNAAQAELRKAEEATKTALKHAEELRDLQLLRSRMLNQFNAVRKSMQDFKGVWLVSWKPIPAKDNPSLIVGVEIKGRAWADALKAIEKNREKNETALDALVSRLKREKVFIADSVTLSGQNDTGLVKEFNIRANFAGVADARATSKKGGRK